MPHSWSPLSAEARRASREEILSRLAYPPELPISAHREEILSALRASQVVVVAGETGSGKSTQLPKLCLEAGGGTTGMIGHTQPRRLAARSIAERLAQEMGSEVGRAVGFKVRFSDRVAEGALVKVMTDGVLLAELHSDPVLERYDTLIIDEAHERSLNIDFILGYVKRLLPKRPDLQVVVTSATIDTQKFSSHFGAAPVVEVPGRTFPVEIRYRPCAKDGAGEEVDQVQAVCDAVGELCKQGPGDILVFLSGEREIRDTAEALSKSGLPDLEILALYARLSAAEQHRVFQAHEKRRVVLATNVAETSLTVPGIRYVVDQGTARVSRYSRRTKVQRLPIEAISQASANQRAGRCGRLGPGVCVRLYSEEDFAGRSAFSEPEILRTNLASVILQMAAIGLGDVEEFPFVDAPDRRNIKDGVALLQEIGALSPQGALTATGRKLAQLPLDPRLGRMVVEGARLGCLPQVIVIAAGLSVQDPRERPAGKEELADQVHARFADPSSDFMTYLALWGLMEEATEAGQFRRFCRQQMISYQRAREWQDVVSQLSEICRALGLSRGSATSSGGGTLSAAKTSALAPWAAAGERPGGTAGAVLGTAPGRSGVHGSEMSSRSVLHRALLAGIVAQVGVRDKERDDYLGVRNARFSIWPGSGLAKAKRQPRWVMVAELVETGRLWGRVAAPAQPRWVENVAGHLLKWSYDGPFWDADRGSCYVFARATLYGLPVVERRRTDFARLDPVACREMFIRSALVEGDWRKAPAFVARNRDVVEELRSLSQRCRRQDLAVGDEALFCFYDAVLGASVTSSGTFAAWLARDNPGRLQVSMQDLIGGNAPVPSEADYPDKWHLADGTSFALSYKWQPGDFDDGVSVDVPFGRLSELESSGLEWQVPGFREELVLALVRSLPKNMRRAVSPAPALARSVVAKYKAPAGPLLEVLARELSEATGASVAPEDFDWGKVPVHLRPLLRVVDGSGRTLAASRDPSRLVAALQPLTRRALAQAAKAAGLQRCGLCTWDFDELPKRFEATWQGISVCGYPALVDEGGQVGVRVLFSEAEQAQAMAAGTSRLIVAGLGHRVGQLGRLLDRGTRLALVATGSYSSARHVVEDVGAAVVDDLVSQLGGPAWDRSGFETLMANIADKFDQYAAAAMQAASRAIVKLQVVQRRLGELSEKALLLPPGAPARTAAEDITRQLAELVGPGFVRRAGAGRLADVERYLRAVEVRLDKLSFDPARDQVLVSRVRAVEDLLAQARKKVVARPGEPTAETTRSLEELRWLLEELRVSMFAQSIGTRVPVSVERLQRSIRQLLA
ncbi:MAG: ATP-dependent RNA helicase HrpA [Acidimicrobiales bacterium]